MSIPYPLDPFGKSEVDKTVPLTFTALENSTIKIIATGSPTVSGLKYKDQEFSNWKPYVIGTVINVGKGFKVQFKNIENTLSTSTSNYVQFVMTGKFEASGNIQSLVNYIDNAPTGCFTVLFYNCSSLTSAPALPAKILHLDCYRGMFQNCTNLVTPPELPATTLAANCYLYMFNGCSSLTSAPALPALRCANQCYYGMFYGCTSLTTPPELPATNLAEYCYYKMFEGCSSLTSAPALPATTLAANCYQNMFTTCSSLTSPPELPATTLAPYCYRAMFQNCISLTIGPTLPATTLASTCYNAMFQGCTSLTKAPNLPASSLVAYCYSGMFYNCSSLNKIGVSFTAWNDTIHATDNWLYNVASIGVFVKPTALAEEYGANRIPTSWRVLNDVIIVDYLGANGTQYINTAITDQDATVELTTRGSYNALCRFGYANNEFRLSIGTNTADSAFAASLRSISRPNIGYGNIHKFKLDRTGKFYIDDELTYEHPGSLTNYLNMYLFACNNNGSPLFNSTYLSQLYNAKIWKNDVLSANLIPILDSNNVPCLYDIVSQQKLYNAGSGDFFYDGKLNYIQSTGTQYIDTGVKPDFANGDSIEVNYFGVENTVAYAVFGSRGLNVTNGVYLAGSNIIFCDSNGYTAVPFDYRNYVTLKIDNVQIIRNDVFIASVPRQVSTSNNVYLFALNSNGTLTSIYSGMKLYSWKYWKNGVLTQYLTPALDSNDIACLYDNVSKQYFYNQGTGNFIYG